MNSSSCIDKVGIHWCVLRWVASISTTIFASLYVVYLVVYARLGQNWSRSVFATTSPMANRQRNRSTRPGPAPPLRQNDSNSQLTHEDCLALLGLNWGATEREIRRAYHTKAQELHPDRSLLPREEATARFQVLNNAHALLRGIDRDEPENEEAQWKKYPKPQSFIFSYLAVSQCGLKGP